MSQEELVTTISERAGISKQTVFEILDAIGDIWAEDLVENGELELENIGQFFIDHRPGRRGLNTQTREVFIIPPQDFISFVPSQELALWSNRIS